MLSGAASSRLSTSRGIRSLGALLLLLILTAGAFGLPHDHEETDCSSGGDCVACHLEHTKSLEPSLSTVEGAFDLIRSADPLGQPRFVARLTSPLPPLRGPPSR